MWVSDPSQVWTAGEVTQSTSSHVVVKLVSADSPEDDLEDLEVPHTGGKVRLLRRDTTIVDAAALQYDDLTNVPELHEAALLQAIADRFQRGRIYTLTGPVLLAVNPFRHMPGLYSPEMLRSFVSSEKLQPHIFSIANRAYQGSKVTKDLWTYRRRKAEPPEPPKCGRHSRSRRVSDRPGQWRKWCWKDRDDEVCDALPGTDRSRGGGERGREATV